MKLISNLTSDDLKNKKVLVRVDYDVPVENGKVKNDTRIRGSLETIDFLTKNGASVILLAHMGRPDGQKVEEFSLLQIASHLEGLIGKSVKFASDILADQTKDIIANLGEGEVVLLENLRFYSGEESNDPEFAQKIASYGNIFVNDSFATAHRAHASQSAIPSLLDSYAGFQLQREVEALTSATNNPKKPLVAIIGGKKVSDKVKVLEHFLNFVDIILVGGGAANVFLASQDYNIGNSFVERDLLDFAGDILYEAEQKGVEVIIPSDVRVVKDINDASSVINKDIAEVEDDDIIVDIGQETINAFADPLKFAGTIIWNGPMGIFEVEEFSKGNKAISKLIADSGSFSLIGGGDTIAGIPKELKDNYSYISTAGGATLDFLAGKKLPGLEHLN
jgi:phosphoglycerate kinase